MSDLKTCDWCGHFTTDDIWANRSRTLEMNRTSDQVIFKNTEFDHLFFCTEGHRQQYLFGM